MRGWILLLGCCLVGCSFAVDVEMLAPRRPRTDFVDVLNGPPPAGSVPLARIHAQGNNYQNAGDCVARLQIEARKVGADLVRVSPEESGLGKGPSCSGVAYAAPPK